MDWTVRRALGLEVVSVRYAHLKRGTARSNSTRTEWGSAAKTHENLEDAEQQAVPLHALGSHDFEVSPANYIESKPHCYSFLNRRRECQENTFFTRSRLVGQAFEMSSIFRFLRGFPWSISPSDSEQIPCNFDASAAGYRGFLVSVYFERGKRTDEVFETPSSKSPPSPSFASGSSSSFSVTIRNTAMSSSSPKPARGVGGDHTAMHTFIDRQPEAVRNHCLQEKLWVSA